MDRNNSRALTRLSAPQRNNYFYGKLLDVPHLQMETNYFNRKRWLLNRLGLGKGVLCGLEVKPSNDGKQLCIMPGVAIDGFGREINVPDSYCFDPWQIVDDCEKVIKALDRNAAHEITIGVCYRECFADYSPMMVTDCNVQEQCVPGTIIESFYVQVKEGRPDPLTSNPEICDALTGNAARGTPHDYEMIRTLNFGAADIAFSGDGKRVLFVRAGQTIILQIYDVDAEATTPIQIATTLIPPLGGVSASPDSGMVFIAQNDGIASIDISSTQPVVTSVVIGKYGACATAPGGKTVYAANLNSPGIDRIDVGTPPTVTSVISGMSPSQLWISSDGHWLYASDSTSGNLIQIDLSVDPPNIVNPFLSSISGILSLRTTAAGTFIYLAEANKVRRIDEAGATTEFQIDATPVSTAFTSDGQYYYVINRTSAQAADLIVFDVETMSPIAHVPLGDTYGVAVVPHRLRAYVTNASPLTSYAPSITVVDATMDEPDSRRALCEVLSGRCPTPDKPCVNLAVVKLADGSIGEIDSCSFRPVVYSNSTLLDMILCLAENSDGTGTGVKSADAVTGTPVSATYDPQTGNIHFVIPPGTTGNDGISVKSADAEIGTPMSAAFDPGTGNIHFVLPPGIPGSDGITVKSADAETGTPVSATFDSVTGNIHFVIPPGKDGNPGTGINPNLAKITKTSWAHEDTWPIDRFITDGLNVDFSAPVFSTSNNSRGWFVVTVEYPIRILSTAPLPYLQESTIFVQHVLGNTNITGSQIYFLPDQNFRNTFNDIALQSLQSELPILCRVVIKCNYLTDNTDNIDGDFLNNQFPTGDGIPGGDFESWFFLTPSTNPPANPVSVSSSRAVRRVKPK